MSQLTFPSKPINEDIISEIRSLKEDMLTRFNNQQTSLDAYNSTLSTVVQEIRVLGAKFSQMREELDEAKQSINFLSEYHDEQIKINNSLNSCTSKLTTDTVKSMTQINELSCKLALLEQRARETNVEIQGIPERKSENLLSITKKICSVVSFNITDAEVLSFSRVAKLHPESKRPRSLIVKFSSQRVRDQLLASVKMFNKTNENNKLNTAQIGISAEETPIFVSEHLSPENKILHAATRMAAKEKNYRFVWIRNGRIFVRKDPTSPVRLIKTAQCLQAL